MEKKGNVKPKKLKRVGVPNPPQLTSVKKGIKIN